MLSTNTLLRDGKYRIGHAISSGQLGAIYTAEDQTTKQQIAVIESRVPVDEGRGEHLMRLELDGLVQITESYQENGYSYQVTEPIKQLEIFAETEELPTESDAARVFDGLSPILVALKSLRVEFPKLRFIEIMPENVIETADGKWRLLFIETPGILFARNPQDSPYLPFERVWNDLDLITQRAFYREFDDAELEQLEAAPDERSDIYSLGAVFYKLLCGRSPLTSFERSFEMLNSKNDPLPQSTSLNGAVNPTQSKFIMKMLELKREDRFTSIDDAISGLSAMTEEKHTAESHDLAAEIDEFDLLEIPSEPQTEQGEIKTNGHNVAEPNFDELVSLSSIHVTAESVSHAEELDSFVQQFYSEGPIVPISAKDEIVEVREEVVTHREAVTRPITEKPDTPTFLVEAEDTPQNTGFAKMIGVAVAGIVVVGVGGFALLNMTSSDEGKSQDQTTYQAPAPSVSTEIQQQPVPSAEPANQNSTVQNTPSQVAGTQPETQPTASKTRPQVAEVKPSKPAETKPAKTEQKPKKKITVDDLLN